MERLGERIPKKPREAAKGVETMSEELKPCPCICGFMPKLVSVETGWFDEFIEPEGA